jgi:hypothetical protein
LEDRIKQTLIKTAKLGKEKYVGLYEVEQDPLHCKVWDIGIYGDKGCIFGDVSFPRVVFAGGQGRTIAEKYFNKMTRKETPR